MNHIEELLSETDPLLKLLSQASDQFVGYAYNITYGELIFLTNDVWKEKVNGIPHNAFLLASALRPGGGGQLGRGADHELDREVLLLRVLAPEDLPQAKELIRTRIEHHQRRTQATRLPGSAAEDGEMDWLTRSEVQAAGLRCRIIGTFYLEDEELRLGSDIENFMAMSPLRIYRPCPEALETIVNHVNREVREKAEQEALAAGFTRAPSPIIIGTVRYTSTRRLQKLQGKDVQVRIAPSDFLARRTAILGMTRTGKSNTVKTTVAAVQLAALKDSVRVGQLIFDLNGEYANANHQDDGSSIADVFPAQTVRYRAMETAGFEDLRLNFYEDPAGAVQLMGQLYTASTKQLSSAQDVQLFFGLDLSPADPNDHGAALRLHNHRQVLSLVLKDAGFSGCPPTQLVPASSGLVKQLTALGLMPDGTKPDDQPLLTALASTNRQGQAVMPQAVAKHWLLLLREANLRLKNGVAAVKRGEWEVSPNGVGLHSSTGEAWVDKTLEVLLNMLASQNSGGTSFIGSRALIDYRAYHSPRRSQVLEPEILAHLWAGKIVILDLSVGPSSIRKVLAERIARYIFEQQMHELHRGKTPQNIVMYVEEAHNLIGKKADLDSTWPRLAKEGAKARIAFVYATQEPSSVHPNVLANTENWFVTHLNNDDELRALAKFYDFADFTASLKVAQDVGFARIKTLSSPFVTPVQILRFTPEDLKRRREELTTRAATPQPVPATGPR